MKKTLIFDLDGTLVDTSRLVLAVFETTIAATGHPIPGEEVMRGTFGHPDDAIWEMLLPGGSTSEREAAYQASSDAIAVAMHREDVLLPGAKDTLTELKRRGYTLTVASNCAPQYLNAILDSQGLRPLMTRPLCLGSVRGRVKADILTEHFHFFNREDAVMIGDRSSDVEAAHAHGIPVIGCQFGTTFASQQELADADELIHHLDELLQRFPALPATP